MIVYTPGRPLNASFPEVSFTTARVNWDVTTEPYSEIRKYRVNFHHLPDKAIDAAAESTS